MEFSEASQIARAHPGSTLTRDASGAFVVILDDAWRVAGGSTSKPDVGASANHQTFEHYREECERLHRDVVAMEEQVEDMTQHAERLERHIAALEARIAKVSVIEWARIAEEERLAVRRMNQAERERLLGLLRTDLGYERVRLILDNASRLGCSPEEIDEIQASLKRAEAKGHAQPVSDHAFAVYSTVDGQ